MDIQSSGALLRILNLVAIADGHLSPEEENLLDSLVRQHKLQAKIISWQDDLDQPASIRALALKIASEHHELAYRTATMVASISRAQGDDDFVCAEEEQLLKDLAATLQLTAEQIEALQREAARELNQHPNLWQVLYACFGSQFERPIFA
jgi:tellurite resistance protein